MDRSQKKKKALMQDKPTKERKNIWLRLILDNKYIFIIIVGLIGIIYIPLHIFPLITNNQVLLDNLEKKVYHIRY